MNATCPACKAPLDLKDPNPELPRGVKSFSVDLKTPVNRLVCSSCDTRFRGSLQYRSDDSGSRFAGGIWVWYTKGGEEPTVILGSR